MSAAASIDGHAVAADGTILDGARALGIDVPTLCYRDGLPAEGGCRVCLVELEGASRPVAACHTPLAPGAVVRTSTPGLDDLRRAVLALELGAHPAGAIRPGAGGSELERLAARLGIGPASVPASAPDDDVSHPYLRFATDLCVTCRRCLHACEQVQGQFVFGIEGRGADTRLIFGPDERFADSDCVACGACVDVCPSGALSDRDRRDGAAPTATTRSTCGYCGVGCQVDVGVAAGVVARIDGAGDAEVNAGHLCLKGRYAHGWQAASDRLTQPLLREDGELRPVSWDRALGWLAERLTAIRDAHGPDALGALASSRSTNEAVYLLQKLFRAEIGTNNVDCCARVCHSSTATALSQATGTGAASASFADIEEAALIVVAGANPTEAHPVVGARIRQAVLAGTPLVVVDPRRIELADLAALHLAPHPGTNVPLFNAIARALLSAGHEDAEYLTERVDGLGVLRAHLDALEPAEMSGQCGVALDDIAAAAELLGRAGPTLFVHGLGLSELTQGVASVRGLANLALLTGSVSRPGAGLLPLRGQNNVQGSADMGAMPERITGYQRLDDDALRQRLVELWGAAPPTRPGLTVTELTEAALTGEVRALWIQGEDAAQSDPSQDRVIASLEALELLVVQDLFLTETGRRAHLVLPAAGWLENDGTFTNGERRIQRVRPALPPPGDARPDWEAVRDLANALGAGWEYPDPAAVMDEIAQIAPALFGGVAYTRLDGDGLQWPCPAPDHPGTARVHADGFAMGRAQLAPLEFVPSPEHDVEGFPFTLITGRVLDHYNVGTMTRRTPNQELVDHDAIVIHPDDAAAAGIEDGAPVQIESRHGRTVAPAQRSDRVAAGTLFMSFHQPESHTNRLVGPQVDPVSKCPEYKVTAVRLRPLPAAV